MPASPPTSNSAEPAQAGGIGLTTGASLIVANMIGVGVFTTTGFMADALGSPGAILLAWAIGGVAAFCGALAYSELGAALPRNGGEYQLLSRIYHPALGFVAGWVSLIVGFAAPLALFAMTFAKYFQRLLPIEQSTSAQQVIGLSLILSLAVLHSLHVSRGSWAHNLLTIGKIGLIVGFIVAGAKFGRFDLLSAKGDQSTADALRSPLFAVQLVYVSFAYTGWNTAAYLAAEFRNPAREVPLAILLGTAIVAVLYVGLNAVFLASAPLDDLKKHEDIAHVAATHLFGTGGGKFVSAMIALGLISTASAITMAGPRVYEAMGCDYSRLRFLKLRRAGGGPFMAIALQASLASFMLMTASFDALLRYIGVTLSLVAGLAVAGVIVLRIREPNLPRPYKTWGYPLTPLVFVALESWMIYYAARNDLEVIGRSIREGDAVQIAATMIQRPVVVSAGTLAVGLLIYWGFRQKREE